MSITVSYPFTTSGNYTYDNTLVEVTGGVAKLKDLRPANATFFAGYGTDINGNWGGGTLTGSATGGAAVADGKLDLAHGDVRYVDYDADLNADSQQVGCVRFVVIPNYSGSPSGDRTFFFACKADGDADNTVFMRHKTTGAIMILVYDQTGATIINYDTPTWSPVAGTSYEIELNWDITTGATRVFVDGTQLGTTQTGTGTRSADIAHLRIGSNLNGSDVSDFKIDYFLVFSAVQHTANYTPGDAPSSTIYSTANPTIYPASTVDADAIEAFTATVTEAGSDLIKAVIDRGGTDYYWDGAAWSTSAGYANSNTAAEINTNCGDFDISLGYSIRPKWYLHSDDGSTTPEIDISTMDYDYFGGSVTAPTTSAIWCYFYDTDGTAMSGVSVTATLESEATYNSEIQIPDNYTQTTTTVANGYWELKLIPNELMEPGNTRYKFVFTIGDYTLTEYRYVPDATSNNYADL